MKHNKKESNISKSGDKHKDGVRHVKYVKKSITYPPIPVHSSLSLSYPSSVPLSHFVSPSLVSSFIISFPVPLSFSPSLPSSSFLARGLPFSHLPPNLHTLKHLCIFSLSLSVSLSVGLVQ